jgi:hypothetical protein
MHFTRLSWMGLVLVLLLYGCRPAEPVEPAVLQGTVTVGPLSPVVRSDETPQPVNPEVYTSRSLNIYREDAETLVKNVPLQGDGTYQVELEPGTYVVALAPNGIDFSKDLPQTISLKPGETVVLDIDIDTGIR